MVHQETEGLLSPIIRDIRLKQVASCMNEDALVLDLACGNGYLKQFLPKGCAYYGVDRIPPSSTDRFTAFGSFDLMADDAWREIGDWLPRKPDYITSIAFLEHISNPGDFVNTYSQLLPANGKIIGTTPHPCGRFIHDSLSEIYLCSREGAEEHEQFLGKKEIEAIALSSGAMLSLYRRFLLGLNQLFVFEYPDQG